MNMNQLIEKQHIFFESGATRDLSFRKQQLKKLKSMLVNHQDELCKAVYSDLRKPAREVVSTELITIVDEINFHLKNLDSWSKPQNAAANLLTLPSKNEVRRVPFGVALIIGTWNYPVSQLILPVAGAISGGNCMVLKPSELAAATSSTLTRLIGDTFEPDYISIIEGGVEISQTLLDLPFNKIFFTGSSRVGKIVMGKAARQLIPVTLELGGKSPAIVHKDADIQSSAKRIMWGKCLNAGQICISPDFVLVHEERKDEFIEHAKSAVEELYGKNPKTSPDYGRIINQHHYQRVLKLLEGTHIITGGETDAGEKYIEPTIVDGVGWEHPVMQEEIFGPVLPVVTYSGDKEPASLLRYKPSPLALYIFSRDDSFIENTITQIPHGGTCINDVIMHIANPNIPFGGTGNSGIGQYHGKYSFEAFTRPHAVMRRKTWPDPSVRYPPYDSKISLLNKLFMK
ncbi:MAG: aldehyde dehydrogenase family protein [Balneolaceae bacterium]